ncbi:MAG: ribonuclease III [Clostridia bacterium]|nr:ribonuclease III [Clostridia bacterium]
MQNLQKALGYTFHNEAHLRLALTHPSTKLPDNQRLEFLGDAVLEFCVSDMLYHKYPQLHEGELTARRAALVCERTLSAIARTLSLGPCLIMGHGEEQTGGREKPSILADAVEAVLAAIYVDGGYEAARDVIRRLFAQDENLTAWRGHDDKSALQEYTQAHGLDLPSYAIIAQEGPDHSRTFTAQVSVMGRPVATGVGNSKKAAEQAAAKAALQEYRNRPGQSETPAKGVTTCV